MNKLEYMVALKHALAGLPPEVVNDMLSAYEMRFIEGASLGRSEEEIAQGLDSPQAVAARLQQLTRANEHVGQGNHGSAPAYSPAAAAKAGASGARLFFSFVGLSIFNLFMLLPAFLFAVMLFTSYVSSLGFLVAGSALTAASMANVNTITLDGARNAMHRHHIQIEDDESTVVRISNDGVQVDGEHIGGDTASTPHKLEKDIRVSIDHDDRVPSFWKGLGLILGGIFLFLLNLVVTKYSFLGLKQYAIMNYKILKNA